MSDDLFTAGDLIIITSGEYSSYGVCSIVRALRSFTLAEVKAIPGCLDAKGPYAHEARISVSGLIATGFVEELPYHREIWTGSC